MMNKIIIGGVILVGVTIAITLYNRNKRCKTLTMEVFLEEVNNLVEELFKNGTIAEDMKLTATLIPPQQTNEWINSGVIKVSNPCNNRSKYRLVLVIVDNQSDSIIASKMIYADQISDDFDCMKENKGYSTPIELD